MGRWIGFFLAILVGALATMFYGWFINPVKLVDTTPSSLRIDYKSDYVLMVAEAYSVEGDPTQAVQRLALLSGQAPLEIVREAILFAEKQGYTDTDVALMRSLAAALETWNPAIQGGSP
jgi:hypothetical protein